MLSMHFMSRFVGVQSGPGADFSFSSLTAVIISSFVKLIPYKHGVVVPSSDVGGQNRVQGSVIYFVSSGLLNTD